MELHPEDNDHRFPINPDEMAMQRWTEKELGKYEFRVPFPHRDRLNLFLERSRDDGDYLMYKALFYKMLKDHLFSLEDVTDRVTSETRRESLMRVIDNLCDRFGFPSVCREVMTTELNRVDLKSWRGHLSAKHNIHHLAAALVMMRRKQLEDLYNTDDDDDVPD